MYCLQVFGFILSSFLVLKLYLKFKTKWCTSNVCLAGKTVIVTGANAGIGYTAAVDFAKRGARVILACRDENKAAEARDKIIRETRNENVVVRLVDFTSLGSVRTFAKDILDNEARLDILVNNAGTSSSRDKLTEDGLQLLMQVNYFGPFLLTVLLIGLLKKSAPSRIVNVSSVLAAYAKLDPHNLNTYNGIYLPYCNSKLCNVLFTVRLARILEQSNVSVFSLHPGVIRTDIYRKFRGVRKFILNFFKSIYFKTPEEGAQTTIYAALEQGIERYSGRHLEECQVAPTYSTAMDPDLPDLVWQNTVRLLRCEEQVKNL